MRGRVVQAAATLAVVVLAYLLPYALGPYYQQVGYRVLQLGALATAWNLLAGYGGLVSLGSASFIGLGAYAAAVVGNGTDLPLPVLLPVGAAVAAVFAVLVSPAMFRLRGLYFTIGTLALSEALRILMVNIRTFGGASGVILQAPTPEPFELYWWALLLAVVATTAVVAVLASPAALSLRGVRDDEDVARQMGVVTFRTKLWAFALSAALMGLVGALQSVKLGVIEPYGGFGLAWTIDIVAVAIIGGLGTRGGPWAGAVFVGVLAELLRDYPEVHTAITGLVMFIVIRFAPHGIWGTISGRRGGRRG
jgi:branched-chain amino acid transport system permease protein